MEKPITTAPESLPENHVSMPDFRAEIAVLRAREESGEGKTANLIPHLDLGEPGVDANVLTLEDALFWRKIKEYPKFGQVSDADWETYSKDVSLSENRVRKQFAAFLRNKYQGVLLQEFRSKKKSA